MIAALRFLSMVVVCLTFVIGSPAAQQTQPTPPGGQLKVFLDCQDCFQDFLRTEVTFVDYVRDRTEADVHILITRAETGAAGLEYTAAFIGSGRFTGVNHTLKTVTTQGDPDDVVRRQLATTMRIGLLNYVAQAGVPAKLAVSVRLGSEESRPAVAGDRWNNWVFSLRGSASFNGEESSRQRELGGEVSADRITPEWKITLGSEFDHEREEFDLDEEDPVKVERREREFRWLVVKGLGEHWSIGGQGEIESSTFDNSKLGVAVAPAIEYNVFPYSMYTRRQLRALYAVGVRRERVLRTNALWQDGRNAASARVVSHVRAARTVGLALGAHRVVAVPSRPHEVPSRGRRRGLGAARARAVGPGASERVSHPGSVVAAGARRHRRRGPAAAAAAAEWL